MSALKMCYETFLHPKVEYAALIWNPYCKQHVLALEQIQKRFLRFVFYRMYHMYLYDVPTRDLLTMTDMHSLEKRTLTCLMFLHKLLHNCIDDMYILERIGLYPTTFSFRTRPLFATERTRTNFRAMSPLIRLLKIYNYACWLDIFAMPKENYKEGCISPIWRK